MTSSSRLAPSLHFEPPPSTAVSARALRPEIPEISPFSALRTRLGRPLRVALLSDFIRIPYANGAVFQTRFLYQELRRCGHDVTVIAPHDPDALPEEVAPGAIALPSIPMKTYPGLHLPMPLEPWVWDPHRWNFDICLAQVTSSVMYFAMWLRKMRGIPLLFVNTTHLAAVYDVLLPEAVSKIDAVHTVLHTTLRKPYERVFRDIYNSGDGLIVLSEGLRDHWAERGVVAPIHVIPRTVQPDIFDRPLGTDPYLEAGVGTGPRLLCAGRLTREKSQDRVIRIFARHILPKERDATLIMVGTGPDTDLYKRVAANEGVRDRVHFLGEVPFLRMRDYYAYTDAFVHGSLSETYGNVLGEALWCGTPTVAFADGMGVSAQIQDGVNGIVLSPGKGQAGEAEADQAFGRSVLAMLRDPQWRGRLGKNASRIARERAHPKVVLQRMADVFQHAQDHAAASGLRPAIAEPKLIQWMTTLKLFRTWAAMNGGVALVGHLRPGTHISPARIHPHIPGVPTDK